MCRKKFRKLSSPFQSNISKHFFVKNSYLKYIICIYSLPCRLSLWCIHVCRCLINLAGMERFVADALISKGRLTSNVLKSRKNTFKCHIFIKPKFVSLLNFFIWKNHGESLKSSWFLASWTCAPIHFLLSQLAVYTLRGQSFVSIEKNRS